MLPIEVNKNDGASEVLLKGVAKLNAHVQQFSVDHPQPYKLLYKNRREVDQLPEGGVFIVEAYKEQVGREYSRILLFVVSNLD